MQRALNMGHIDTTIASATLDVMVMFAAVELSNAKTVNISMALFDLKISSYN